MSPEVQRELQRLLSALCDGAITEAEHARLEQLLGADAECRRQYLEYLDMHARLLVHPRLGEGGLPLPGEEAAPAPAKTGRRRAGQVLRYAAVMAATLAASLLVQVFWWHPRGPDANGSQRPAGERPEAGYVATLTRAADCSWEGPGAPPRAGARLAAGELRLHKGVAQIRFDSGSELLVEGPADVHLDSGTSATLLRGKAVFRADEAAPPFDLHTPASTLEGLATEFAVAVSAEGEEVHVFEGEVQHVPAAAPAEAEVVRAGEARRSGRTGLARQPIALDAARFVRSLPPAEVAEGLMAYEGFDYADAGALPGGKANGGFGWAGPWAMTFAHPPRVGAAAEPPLNVKESLVRPAAAVPSAGGRFEYAGSALYYRRLASPVRLDSNGVYYFSFLFRRQGPSSPYNVLALTLRPDEEPGKWPDLSRRLTIGLGGSNQVFSHLGRSCARASVPLPSGTTYLLVAKVVANNPSPGQVFVRVYGPREPVGREEPGSWTVVSPPFHSDLVLDWLGVHASSNNRQMIDEIRLGTTWSSVTAPWAAR